MITDGAVRDLDGIAEAGLPVFAAAVTPNSSQKDGPGEINVPIACGGQVVHPGDIVVGDRDGVVVVPRQDAAAALIELERIRSYETERLEAINRGDYFPPGLDQLLVERGAVLVDAPGDGQGSASSCSALDTPRASNLPAGERFQAPL
jgi:regulator of RNase E activity RraA